MGCRSLPPLPYGAENRSISVLYGMRWMRSRLRLIPPLEPTYWSRVVVRQWAIMT